MDFVRSYFRTKYTSAHSKTSQKVRKKCSTGQRFICTEVTSYKIHTLVLISFTVHQFGRSAAAKNCWAEFVERLSSKWIVCTYKEKTNKKGCIILQAFRIWIVPYIHYIQNILSTAESDLYAWHMQVGYS